MGARGLAVQSLARDLAQIMSPDAIPALRAALLDWYDRGGRTLPWRVRPEDRARGVRPDPFAVWLSEIMLQQTTVAAATPYWRAFLARWPTVEALAAAPLEEVLAAWAGLGYYARARNLHACAKAVAARGGFPTDEASLLALPGVGPYTAAAIAAICGNEATNVVDGNVERVIARLTALEAPFPAAKPEARRRAAPLADPVRPGDYAQAIMDLGATVCRPKAPLCLTCPWRPWCRAAAAGAPAAFPKKSPKAERPHRHGVAFALFDGGRLWLRRRPPRGLLGGLPELPGTPWRAELWTAADALDHAPAPANWAANWDDVGAIEHVFTHFTLTLEVRRGEAAGAPAGEGWWADPEDPAIGLPSVMAKALARARG